MIVIEIANFNRTYDLGHRVVIKIDNSTKLATIPGSNLIFPFTINAILPFFRVAFARAARED
jgi:hypothetical protein